MINKTAIVQPLQVATAAVILSFAACGEVEPADDSSSSLSPATEIQGVVVDGYIEGAKVFIDLNHNYQADVGEPTAETDDKGTFRIRVREISAEQLKTAYIQADVSENAKDTDDLGATLENAGKSGFSMMSPFSEWANAMDEDGALRASGVVVSPLSTLVVGEMISLGQNVEEAKKATRVRLGLDNKELLNDFVADADPVLQNIARAAAIGLGEAMKEARLHQDDAGNGVTARTQLMDGALKRVREQMPEVIDSLNIRQAGALLSTESIKNQWAYQETRQAQQKGDTSTAGDWSVQEGSSSDAGIQEHSAADNASENAADSPDDSASQQAEGSEYSASGASEDSPSEGASGSGDAGEADAGPSTDSDQAAST